MKPREKKKSARPVASVKSVILVTYVLAYLAVMTYGAVVWRHAPIRERNGQYVDKRGEVHSAEEYRRFVLWERAALTLGFGGVVVLLAGTVAGKFLKSRREGAVKRGGGA